jgi:hypothetical protein
MPRLMMSTAAEPRCPQCQNVLVHAGAICVICDDQTHYEAPIRTSPPLSLPDGAHDDGVSADELRSFILRPA